MRRDRSIHVLQTRTLTFLSWVSLLFHTSSPPPSASDLFRPGRCHRRFLPCSSINTNGRRREGRRPLFRGPGDEVPNRPAFSVLRFLLVSLSRETSSSVSHPSRYFSVGFSNDVGQVVLECCNVASQNGKECVETLKLPEDSELQLRGAMVTVS